MWAHSVCTVFGFEDVFIGQIDISHDEVDMDKEVLNMYWVFMQLSKSVSITWPDSTSAYDYHLLLTVVSGELWAYYFLNIQHNEYKWYQSPLEVVVIAWDGHLVYFETTFGQDAKRGSYRAKQDKLERGSYWREPRIRGVSEWTCVSCYYSRTLVVVHRSKSAN